MADIDPSDGGESFPKTVETIPGPRRELTGQNSRQSAMTTTTFVLALLATVVVSFVVLWVAICQVLASVSGWKRLQRLYATGPFEGETSKSSGHVGRSRFRGAALIVGASRAGLYLNVVPPFRIGAGPVLIPWRKIAGPSPSPGLIAHLTLEIPEAGTSLRLPESVTRKLLERRASVLH